MINIQLQMNKAGVGRNTKERAKRKFRVNSDREREVEREIEREVERET